MALLCAPDGHCVYFLPHCSCLARTYASRKRAPQPWSAVCLWRGCAGCSAWLPRCAAPRRGTGPAAPVWKRHAGEAQSAPCMHAEWHQIHRHACTRLQEACRHAGAGICLCHEGRDVLDFQVHVLPAEVGLVATRSGAHEGRLAFPLDRPLMLLMLGEAMHAHLSPQARPPRRPASNRGRGKGHLRMTPMQRLERTHSSWLFVGLALPAPALALSALAAAPPPLLFFFALAGFCPQSSSSVSPSPSP
jgi:hypothetical protein